MGGPFETAYQAGATMTRPAIMQLALNPETDLGSLDASHRH